MNADLILSYYIVILLPVLSLKNLSNDEEWFKIPEMLFEKRKKSGKCFRVMGNWWEIFRWWVIKEALSKHIFSRRQ